MYKTIRVITNTSVHIVGFITRQNQDAVNVNFAPEEKKMIECTTMSSWKNIGGVEYHPQIAVDFPDLPFEVIEGGSCSDKKSAIKIYPKDMEMLNKIKNRGYAIKDMTLNKGGFCA